MTNKKWEIFVVHNTHTDLGYTHRQEWVYRAHLRFIEKAIDICEKNDKFRWTCETFWTVENFLSQTTEEYKEKFQKYIDNGQIEITTSYLNTSQLMDPAIVLKKAKIAAGMTKDVKVAVFQDVNGISREYGRALAEAGTEYVQGSIHTHHGMWVGDGKQRPFIWDLENGKKLLVLNTEHYQIGNEIFDHADAIHKYTFKDKVEEDAPTVYERGLLRLKRYLRKLEEEGYEWDSLLIPSSGRVTDNSPPNERIVEAVEKYSAAMPENVTIKLTTTKDFFESLEKEINEGKKVTTLKGEWCDWWTDGVITTPEAVRIYREAQNIYRLITGSNIDLKPFESEIEKMENAMAMFAEHTWGHFTSTGDPYSNENNLLLARKKGMAYDASLIGWQIIDLIKEQNGQEFVRLYNEDGFTVMNPFDEELEFSVPFELDWEQMNRYVIDHYVEDIDAFELVDKDGNIYPATITNASGGMENINTTGSSILLARIKLKPSQKLELKLRKLEINDNSWSSSNRFVGAENEEDILDGVTEKARYNRNGIESKFYKIEWSNARGVHTILDKETGENIVDGLLFQPIYDVSPGSSRRKMGRNRKGPSYKKFIGQLVDHKIVHNKSMVQLVELTYEVEGSNVFKILIRLSNLSKDIDVSVKIQKQITSNSENLYLELPFKKDREITVIQNDSSFKPWVEQIKNSIIDYMAVDVGVIFEGKTSIALSMPDTPMLQLGSLEFERRQLMTDGLDLSKQNPHIWLMNNYWETNFAGTLEGNYQFHFSITSGKDSKKLESWLHNKRKGFLSWPNYSSDWKA